MGVRQLGDKKDKDEKETDDMGKSKMENDKEECVRVRAMNRDEAEAVNEGEKETRTNRVQGRLLTEISKTKQKP